MPQGFISKDSELGIRIGLKSQSELHIRDAFKKICESYQDGQYLEPSASLEFSRQAHYFVHDERYDVSIWAIKALVEIANREDLSRLESYIIHPRPHPEFFGWAIAAFMRVATEEEIRDRVQRGIIPKNELARVALAFARPAEDWDFSFPPINIEDATWQELKWACLCMASSRGVDTVFEPRFRQRDQLVALNLHDHEEVSQYSIYAMTRRKDSRFSHLKYLPQDIMGLVPEVRRWSYHLLAQHEASIRKNIDFFRSVIKNEVSSRALLGMATATKGVWFDGIEPVMMDWYASNDNKDINQAILVHMASNADHCDQYKAEVLDRWGKSDSPALRAAIKADAAGTSLYGDIVRREDAESGQGLMVFMSKKVEQNIYGSNNIIGQNIVGSNVGSASSELSVDVPDAIIDLVTQLIESANKEGSDESSDFVDAAKSFISKKTKEAAKWLIDVSQKWYGELASEGAVAMKLSGLIAFLMHLPM